MKKLFLALTFSLLSAQIFAYDSPAFQKTAVCSNSDMTISLFYNVPTTRENGLNKGIVIIKFNDKKLDKLGGFMTTHTYYTDIEANIEGGFDYLLPAELFSNNSNLILSHKQHKLYWGNLVIDC